MTIKEKEFLENFKKGKISIQITTLDDYNKFIAYISKQFKQLFPIKNKIGKPFKLCFSKKRGMVVTSNKTKNIYKIIELNFIGGIK